MTSGTHRVAYGRQTIHFAMKRSSRKTLAIHVHPDLQVEVIAPRNAGISKVYEKVKKRARWIKTQQLYFERFHPKPQAVQYVSGSDVRYLGKQFRLKVKRDIVDDVKLSGRYLLVSSHHPADQLHVKALVEAWFRASARRKFEERIALCREHFRDPKAFCPTGTIIRRLSNRWGSIAASKRLILNVKLIHEPLVCIDYVIIHELCHLRHPNHSPKFWKLLKSVLPDWEKRKKKLECVV